MIDKNIITNSSEASSASTEDNYEDDPDYNPDNEYKDEDDDIQEDGEDDDIQEDDEEEYEEDEEEYEEGEEGEEDEEDEEYDEEGEEEDQEPRGGYFNKHDEDAAHHQNIYLILNSHNPRQRAYSRNTSRRTNGVKQTIKKARKINKFYKLYNPKEKDYFDTLPLEEQDNIENMEGRLVAINSNDTEPMRFKFLRSSMNDRTKKIIISKLENLNNMATSASGEYYKLHNWINILNDIPFGKFYEIPIKNTDGNHAICTFLENVRHKMNDTIYGHKEAKEQIIRILAQLISFPRANGYIIGIQGDAGVGKTKLIKEGICNALNYPHAFISLGGVEDSSYLRGHSYTYEGATYGKICESLIKTGIMNPLILFDELDKVSNTYRGQEIINTLIHITDPVQNDKFNDRYFEEIDLDISRSMIIFTYNDESFINPILKDRMIVINVAGYNQNEKLILAKDYILPELLKQYNLNKEDMQFSDEVLKYIIETTEKEEGVRNLKRAINNIISWINMMRYVSIDDIKITFPFEVTIKYYDKYCKSHKSTINRDILHSMYL